MQPFIHDNWYCWESNGQILLSNEVLKNLSSFWNIDNAVNWLYAHGNLSAAKALHAHNKATK